MLRQDSVGISMVAAKGTNTLVVVAKRLDGAVPNVVVLRGGMGSRQRRELAEQMSGISDG